MRRRMNFVQEIVRSRWYLFWDSPNDGRGRAALNVPSRLRKRTRLCWATRDPSPRSLLSSSGFRTGAAMGQCPEYIFSPASTRNGRWFCRGGIGHVANTVNTQGQLYALLKSRITFPAESGSAL